MLRNLLKAAIAVFLISPCVPAAAAMYVGDTTESVGINGYLDTVVDDSKVGNTNSFDETAHVAASRTGTTSGGFLDSSARFEVSNQLASTGVYQDRGTFDFTGQTVCDGGCIGAYEAEAHPLWSSYFAFVIEEKRAFTLSSVYEDSGVTPSSWLGFASTLTKGVPAGSPQIQYRTSYGSPGGPLSLSISGVLDPGVYLLWTLSNAQVATGGYGIESIHASFHNTLTVAPVPLPAAAWLLLSGLGAIGAFARRRRGTSDAKLV